MRKLPEDKELLCKWFILVEDCVIRLPCIRTHCLEWGQQFLSLADYKETTREYGFFESFPAGVQLGVNTLKGYVNDMKYVFTKEGAKSVGGFGTIGSIFRKYGIGIVFGK